MKKMKCKILSILAASLALGCGYFGVQTLNTTNASATGTALDYGTYFTLDGAGIRAKANDNNYNGIRFTALLDSEIYEVLESKENDANVTVDYGMIIAPMSYHAENPFTKDNLFGAKRTYYIDGVTEAADNLTKLGGSFVETLADSEKAGKKQLRGVIHNIPEEQLTREYVGVPYICITTNDVPEYYVGNYTAMDSRSMVYVAQQAYNDDEHGLSNDAYDYLQSYYLTKAAEKSYTYTVEYIGVDPLGKETSLKTFTSEEKMKLGTTVTAVEETFEGYTFDETKSIASGIVYANNRTMLKMYYNQDHLDVMLTEMDCTVKVENGGSKEYALTSETSYDFTVTPNGDYDNKTQQIYVKVNGKRIYTVKEGTYSLPLANYADEDLLNIEASIFGYTPSLTVNQDVNMSTVEAVNEGEFAGAWKYTSISGGQTTGEWGDSGVYFHEVYHPLIGSQDQTFYAKGFKYIALQIYFTDSVETFNVRQGTGQNGTNSLNKVGFGARKPTSSIVSFGDGKNTTCEYLYKNMWYTMYIEPTKDNMITIYTNGGSEENPSVVYIKNISYETEKPTYTTTLTAYNDSQASTIQIGQTMFNGESVWKYVNTNGVRLPNGKQGVCFDELTHNSTSGFFGKGFNYVKLDFYIPESVTKIDFKPDYQGIVDHSVWEEYTIGYNFRESFKTSETWMFYDEEGNRVTTKLEHNKWYTLWILATDISYPQMLIQASGTVTENSAPTLYFKNISYEKTK